MKILRDGIYIVIIFPDNTFCSKTFNGKDKFSCLDKAVQWEKKLLSSNNLTKDWLLSRDKVRHSFLWKFTTSERRPQDKKCVIRIVYKNISRKSKYVDYRNQDNFNKRISELEIPFQLANKQIKYIRESRIEKYRDTIEKILPEININKYIFNYKLSKGIKV
jgi:hypothetical protein